MRSNTEHVIELLHTLETIGHPTDRFRRPIRRQTATRVEHMFDISAGLDYIRPYERQR
jgi:hypothetical protein